MKQNLLAQLKVYRRCCARISQEERSARGQLATRPPPGAPSRHTTLHYYTVGHEKSRSFAGCPYQRVRGDFHLSNSRGHTALVDDRRALRP